MIILVINSGSSSLKFQLLNMDDESVMAQGQVEKIGLESGIFTIKAGGEKHKSELAIADHEVAMKLVLDGLLKTEGVGLSSLDEIDAVGHRIVQGGEYIQQSSVGRRCCIQTKSKNTVLWLRCTTQRI